MEPKINFSNFQNFCDSPKPDILFKQTKVDSGLCCHLIYRDEYNITACGLEKMHPFDSCKYGRVIQFLEEKGLINRNQLYSPPVNLQSFFHFRPK